MDAIVYESKTGFTEKYARMLGDKTNISVFSVEEAKKQVKPDSDIIYMGWVMAGKIKGLKKVKGYNLKAVCACGTAKKPEPSEQEFISQNKIENIPFFYLRGGCKPIKEIRGFDKIMLSAFVSMLKKQKNQTEDIKEAIYNTENGFDGVKEENLAPLRDWLSAKK